MRRWVCFALVLLLATPAVAQGPGPHSCQEQLEAANQLIKQLEKSRSDIEYAAAWDISRYAALAKRLEAELVKGRADATKSPAASATPPASATPRATPQEAAE